MDLGLLLLRSLPAALLFGHATQKLFGWSGGAGPAATGVIFERWGFRPGRRLAVLAGLCELAGAASTAPGLLTPGSAGRPPRRAGRRAPVGPQKARPGRSRHGFLFLTTRSEETP